MTEGLAGEVVVGYACSCGFVSENKNKFNGHIGGMQAKEGKEAHQSLGKINVATGEIIMPPYKDRTPDQIYETKFGKARASGEIPSLDGTSPMPSSAGEVASTTVPGNGKKNPNRPMVASTNVLTAASQVRFVPRVYTTNLTPIMLLGYETATGRWGWRPDMPFENFLDTVIYNYFFEHGTKLQAAITIMDDEEFEQELEKESQPPVPDLEQVELDGDTDLVAAIPQEV